VIDDVLPSPHFPEVQRPPVELIKRSLQTNIQARIADPYTNGLVVRFEENPMDLQTLASLPMGLHMKEEEVEEGHSHEHEEGDTEPGEVQAFPYLGKREDRQSTYQGKKPERKPGPTWPMASKIDENKDRTSDAPPKGQAQSEPSFLQNLSHATHCPSAMKWKRTLFPTEAFCGGFPGEWMEPGASGENAGWITKVGVVWGLGQPKRFFEEAS